MYRHHGELWPQSEPITGREVCWFCWNQDHQHCGLMYDGFNRFQCDHWLEHLRKKDPAGVFEECDCKFECDCVHLSEQAHVGEERARQLAHGRERRQLMRSLRNAENNPLRAINPEFKPKGFKPK